MSEPRSGNHPDRWRALAIACLGVFLLVTTLSALNVALAEIAEAFTAEIEDLQWIVDAYAVTFAGLLLAGGAIGDRIGRREALTIGFAIFAVANLASVFADGVWLLIALRAGAGTGAAIMMPATLATVSEVFDDASRGRAIGVWSSIAAAGGAFGPALGGGVVSLWGWPAVFAVTAILGAVGLVGARAWVPHLPGQRQTRFDGLGAALSIAATASLVYLVIEGPGHLLTWSTLFAASAAVVTITWFIKHQARSDSPLLPLELFNSRERVAGAGVLTLAAIGFNGVFFVGALMVQIGWGESALIAGLLLIPIGIIEVIVANVAVSVKDRVGLESTISTGLVLMATGYVAMGFTPEGNRWFFVVAGVIAGIGNGLTIPLSVDRIMSDVEPSYAGVAASVNDMSIELGASMGIGLLGAVQRIGFERALPANRDPIISEVADDAARSAFRSGSTTAFVVAAVIALAAVPVARSTLRPPMRFSRPPRPAAHATAGDS